jgi:hypothetical protein
MVTIKSLAHAPKDIDTMLTRKVAGQDYMIQGVALNKKSHKSYNIELQMDTKTMEPDSMVKVVCNCEDFKFRWAYVLSEQGALLNPRNFQLTPPVKTNPDETLNACKHIHAFIHQEMKHALKVFSNRKNAL